MQPQLAVLLRDLKLFMYGFTIKITMLVSAKKHYNRFLKGVSIYKAFVNLSSPANKSVQLWVKRELEIEGV